MPRYTTTWNPFRGLGAAQWTDYAPPAHWAGAGPTGYGAAQWTDYAPPAHWAGYGGPGATALFWGAWTAVPVGLWLAWRRKQMRWLALSVAGPIVAAELWKRTPVGA